MDKKLCRYEFYKKNILIESIITIVVILIAFVVIAEWSNFFLPQKGDSYEIADNINKIYSICLILLTFSLVIVAWVQLHKIVNTTKSEFLLRIDERYGSEPIIKARSIIQKLYCEVKYDGITKDIRIKKIQERIKEIAENGEKADDATYLLNFLDFLETIAYFCNNDDISISQLAELSGDSCVFYYKIFKSWIYFRRENHNPKFYSQLELLVERIEKENLK